MPNLKAVVQPKIFQGLKPWLNVLIEHIFARYMSSSPQLQWEGKLESLTKLQEIPKHLELLEKVLLDSAVETFTIGLQVNYEQIEYRLYFGRHRTMLKHSKDAYG